MLLSSSRVAIHHVKVKPRCAVLTMLKRLDKIRFRGPRTRDDLSDLAESPPASDNECSDDMQLKPKAALRETEELLRDPVSTRPTLLRDYGNVCVCVCVWAALFGALSGNRRCCYTIGLFLCLLETCFPGWLEDYPQTIRNIPWHTSSSSSIDVNSLFLGKIFFFPFHSVFFPCFSLVKSSFDLFISALTPGLLSSLCFSF